MPIEQFGSMGTLPSFLSVALKQSGKSKMVEVTLNQELVEALVQKWAKKTEGGEELAPHIPLQALQTEALGIAHLFDKKWASEVVDGKQRHGLESVANSGTIHAGTGTEIRELQSAVGECNADYNTLIQRSQNPPLEQAEGMLGEFRGVLGFLLEDGNHPDGEKQLAQLRDIHNDPDSMQGLAMALEGYAELAEAYKAELAQLPRFPLGMIDESLQVARDLRMRSVERESGDLVRKQRETIALRNRLIFAMYDRVNKVRRAVRYVFADDPEIVRQAGSAYERARRKAGKAKPQEEPVTGEEPTLDMPTPVTP